MAKRKVIVKKIVWDEWNITHIARHQVLSNEVEEVCEDTPQAEAAEKGRLRLTGITIQGRVLSLFLDPELEDGVYYPVPARDASRKERKAYQEWLKERLAMKSQERKNCEAE